MVVCETAQSCGRGSITSITRSRCPLKHRCVLARNDIGVKTAMTASDVENAVGAAALGSSSVPISITVGSSKSKSETMR